MFICNCGKEFEKKKSLSTHGRFCSKFIKKEKPSSKYKIDENLYRCECDKEFNNHQSLNAHFCYCSIHRNGIPSKEKLKNKNWSKGLTKYTDERVKRYGESLSNNIKLGKTKPTMLGKNHSVETKLKLSIIRSEFIFNNLNWCKYYSISNGIKEFKVQGTYEKRIAEFLNSNNIKWDRIKIKYNNYRHYTPDFYLPDYNIYLEVKGWLKDRDKEKMNQILLEYPNLNIKLIFEKEIKLLESNSIKITELLNYKFL